MSMIALHHLLEQVAPFTGAWIEMSMIALHHLLEQVAPFTGAWIEMKQKVRL